MPAGEDGLNPWTKWLQTPLRLFQLFPVTKRLDSPKADCQETLQAAQWGGSIPKGFPSRCFKESDPAPWHGGVSSWMRVPGNEGTPLHPQVLPWQAKCCGRGWGLAGVPAGSGDGFQMAHGCTGLAAAFFQQPG